MFRKHELIPSRHMGRPVNLWRYGHYGPPLIAFPSASGMAHEWESNDMVAALAPWLEEGKLKLYTVESNVSAVWTRKEVPAQERIKQHLPYERWVIDELVPFIRHDCQNHTDSSRRYQPGCTVRSKLRTEISSGIPLCLVHERPLRRHLADRRVRQ